MTTYLAFENPGTTASLLVATYQVRIAQVYSYATSTGASITLSTYSGSISGGTAVTPKPLRVGAPASACTFKYSPTTPGSAVVFATVAGNTFEPSLDLLLNPGTVLYVQAAAGIGIYYEEQRNLSWSY